MTSSDDVVERSDQQLLALLRRASGGDQAAWNELYGSHRALMRSVLRDRIPPAVRARFDTEDIMQSAFLALVSQGAEFEIRDAPSFRAWLRRVLLNKLRDRLREAASDMRDKDRETRPPTEFVESQPDGGPDLHELVARAELQARMLEEIDALPKPDQDLVAARYLEQRPWPEVCRITGLGEAAARRRLQELLERLMRDFL